VAGALLAALLAYALGRVLFGPVAGAVAAVALAFHAGVVAASQQVRPYTLAIAAILLASLVLVLALERSPAWWLAYVPACALLALTHPLAVTVVAAHVVAAALALHGSRRHLGWSAAGLALGVAAAAPLALAAVADRSDAADGSGGFDVRELTTGLGRAAGWNAALLALAGLGLVVLVGGRLAGAAPWHAALVGGLVAAPLIGVLLAEPFLPVFPQRALVVCAPGLALACGAGVAWMPRRAWRWAAVGAVGALALPALAGWYATPAPEDWRSAVRELEAARDERETVVVVPERAAAAVAYYAPELRLSGRARGDGAWVFVRSGSDRLAIRAARRVVRTPAYALLAQERHGERLVLQHWVRP
jgi:mannosyltransferase